MKVDGIEPDILGQPCVWLPFRIKSKEKYALLKYKSEMAVAVPIYTKRINENSIISHSLAKAFKITSVSSQIEVLKLFDNAAVATMIKLQLTEESYSLELYEIVKRRAEFVALHLKGQVLVAGSTISVNLLGKIWSFFVKEILLQEPIAINENIIGKVDFKTEILFEQNIEFHYLPKAKSHQEFTNGVGSIATAVADLLNVLHSFVERVDGGEDQVREGYLLHGASGTGKTSIAKYVAKASGLNWAYEKSANLLFSSEGETELIVLKLFERMIELGPSILILDDIDELFESGNNLNYAGGCYIVHLLIEIFAEFNEKQSSKNSIFLIGITSRLSLIDSILLSSAVFCSRFEVNLPNLQDRKIILKKLLEYKAEFSDDHLETYIEKIAVASQGFSCSDIVNILRSAILKQKTNDLTLEAVLEAAKKVKPANLAGIVSHIPKVYFKDLYGMDEVIGKLKAMVVDPFCKVQKYEGFGVKTPKGILIEGPSNVGKTALACALANETDMACIYVSSPSLRSKIVGESELAISKLFSQAKSSAPCIILMDQFEMLLSRRGKNQSSTGSSDRIVTTFLTEMDGIFTSTSVGVFIIAITTNSEHIDEAILRPGRLDIRVDIPIPNQASRIEILKKSLILMPNSLSDSQIEKLAESLKGQTSGFIVDMCREAAMNCIRRSLDSVTINEFKLS